MKLNIFTKVIRYAGSPPAKLLLVMKLTTFLLLIALVQASAKGYGQISLHETNKPVEKVLESIKKQTGYVFLYDADLLDNKKVSIIANNEPLNTVLDQCFKDLPLTYKILEKNVVITKKEDVSDGRKPNSVLAFATIDGTVIDENGPLIGVSVRVKGSNHVTSTNKDGIFSLQDVRENDVIVFSYVGYKTQEIKFVNSHSFNVKLEQDINGLDQVVVIGYGTTQKKDLTGSVSTINAAAIEDVPFLTVDNALAGKAAGVQVTKSDGTPGGAVRKRIVNS